MLAREDFSIRKCIHLTEALAVNADKIGVNVQEMLFVLEKCLAAFVVKNGMDDKIEMNFDRIKEHIKDIRRRMQGTIWTP